MAINYFKSEHIKVFPCQNRGTQGNSIVNPAARMLSEYNLTHIADTNFESYAITKTNLISDSTFNFVLGGYYFEVSLNSETIGLLTNSYLAIHKENNNGIQSELVPFKTASARESSSSILDDGTYFLGIGISANKEDFKDLSTIEPIKFFDENGNQIKSTLRPELRHGTGEESLIAGDTNNNTASAKWAISIGNNTQATGSHAFAQGQSTAASGIGSHAEGYGDDKNPNKAQGNFSHTEGTATQATGKSSHAEGDHTTASAEAAHSEGYNTEASSTYSHAEGAFTKAQNSCAHSEGKNTTASGNAAHAEGYYTKASSKYAHAEGVGKAKDSEQDASYTTASGEGAHAEGYCTTASGIYAHSEGKNTTASGEAAHAAGVDTIANGIGSFTAGLGTTANADHQTVIGKYNSETTSLFTIGNGKINSEGHVVESNALTVDSTDIKLYNNTTIGTPDVNASLTVNGEVRFNNISEDTNLTGSLCLDSNNKLVKGANYAGGTKVTLNGANKGASEASFYAITSLPTEPRVLVANEYGISPNTYTGTRLDLYDWTVNSDSNYAASYATMTTQEINIFGASLLLHEIKFSLNGTKTVSSGTPLVSFLSTESRLGESSVIYPQPDPSKYPKSRIERWYNITESNKPIRTDLYLTQTTAYHRYSFGAKLVLDEHKKTYKSIGGFWWYYTTDYISIYLPSGPTLEAGDYSMTILDVVAKP